MKPGIVSMRMQQVSFREIDECLQFIPRDELILVEKLRALVLNSIPNVIERLAYNVPFYKVHKNICFIWPSSVLWGKTISFKGARFGFSNGYLLRDEMRYLDRGNRKQVFWKDFAHPNEIDTDLLRSYIFEAVEIDKGLAKK